jgi:transcription elongation factor Elf1
VAEKRKKKQQRDRLFRCDDCGNEFCVQTAQLFRAAKPRCMNCGCTRLIFIRWQRRTGQ